MLVSQTREADWGAAAGVTGGVWRVFLEQLFAYWQSGDVVDCKPIYKGSIPLYASKFKEIIYVCGINGYRSYL